MDLYQNKYRIPSARAQWWNYGWNAAYFITICTANRECLLGNVSDGKMQLSRAGVIADICWHEIKNHAHNIELGEFVIMPNHIHGILILNADDDSAENTAVVPAAVETGHALSLHNHPPQNPPARQIQPQKTIGQERFQNIGKNTISSIVGSYKSAVTKHANRLGIETGWQPRFHDHIIQNPQEYERITDYILNNPAKWEEDKFYVY